MSQQSGNQWGSPILGCLSDPRLCILTFCCPCYTIGKNAEGIGEDCLIHGLLFAIGLNFGPVIRWRLRQEKNLQGSMLLDVLLYAVLPCCSMIQEAKEIGWSLPKEVQEIGKKEEQEMTRE